LGNRYYDLAPKQKCPGNKLERSSRLLHINKIKAKKSHRVLAAITERLGSYPEFLRRSITYDNGSENVDHREINKALGTRHISVIPTTAGKKARSNMPSVSFGAFCQKKPTLL